MRTTFTLLIALFFFQNAWAVSVTVRFLDETAKVLTPVRVELIDSLGKSVVADNALPLGQDCAFAPLPSWLTQPPPNSLDNPFTGTEQHYVNGVGRYQLQPGSYHLRVFKGPEYHVEKRRIVVANQPIRLLIELRRWASLSRDRWASVDAHLHLARSKPEPNTNLSLWMAGEDLQIANLLQMGALTHFAASPQYSFGDPGADNRASTLLLSGQEHPRTHLLGHAISLGALTPVDERPNYIQYNETFKQVREAGGISGFAHWGAGPSRDGLALNVPLGNVEILEVLSFEFLYLDTWYELLNLGYRLTAVAGTDFPCLPGIPGRERTYIEIAKPQTREAMVNALRNGRTFVSNGPMLGLAINGQGIGSKLRLASIEQARIEGHVEYNPKQDALQTLDLIHNGKVIRTWPLDGSGRFSFQENMMLPNPGWVALRVVGRKLRETKPPASAFPAWMETAFSNWMSGGTSQEIGAFLEAREWRGSYAHTSPIYLEGTLGSTRQRKGNANELLERLNRIEAVLISQNFDEVMIWDWMPYSDGVDEKHLKDNTPELLRQIGIAKRALIKRASIK